MDFSSITCDVARSKIAKERVYLESVIIGQQISFMSGLVRNLKFLQILTHFTIL